MLECFKEIVAKTPGSQYEIERPGSSHLQEPEMERPAGTMTREQLNLESLISDEELYALAKRIATYDQMVSSEKEECEEGQPGCWNERPAASTWEKPASRPMMVRPGSEPIMRTRPAYYPQQRPSRPTPRGPSSGYPTYIRKQPSQNLEPVKSFLRSDANPNTSYGYDRFLASWAQTTHSPPRTYY